MFGPFERRGSRIGVQRCYVTRVGETAMTTSSRLDKKSRQPISDMNKYQKDPKSILKHEAYI